MLLILVLVENEIFVIEVFKMESQISFLTKKLSGNRCAVRQGGRDQVAAEMARKITFPYESFQCQLDHTKLKKNITATDCYKVLTYGGRSKYIRPNLPDIILVVIFG